MHFFTQPVGENFPAIPVAFGHAVFDADDGVFVDPSGQHIGPLLRAQTQAFARQFVLAFLVKLGGGAIQAQGDLFTGHVTGFVDGFQNHLDRGLMVGHIGGKAAFVAYRRADAFVMQNFLERVEDFRAVAQGFAKAGRTQRNDHQLLQVEVVVGVLAAVDDVHHGHRHLHRAHAAKVAVQGQTGFFGRSARHRHRDRQHGVGTQARLVGSAVQIHQGSVQKGLLGGIQTQHGLGDFGVDELDRAQHALAAVTAFVPVAQLNRLTAAGGCARRHGRAAHGAGLQQHITFDRGVTPAVQNLASYDVNNGTHQSSFKRLGWYAAARPSRVVRELRETIF